MEFCTMLFRERKKMPFKRRKCKINHKIYDYLQLQLYAGGKVQKFNWNQSAFYIEQYNKHFDIRGEKIKRVQQKIKNKERQ